MPALRRIVLAVISEELSSDQFELGVHLLGVAPMTHLNEEHLKHAGCTDVITFDYADPARREWLGGDIFVCVPEATRQASQFRTRWEEEVVRYIVHGLLHLKGFDDRSPRQRQRMKREENRVLRSVKRRFALGQLGGKRSRRATSRA